MEVKIEQLADLKKRLSIELGADEVSKAYNQASTKLSRKVSYKGFRKGKVPRTIIDQHFAAEVRQEVLQNLLPKCFEEALTDAGERAATSPTFNDLKLENGTPLTFSAEFESMPVFELPQLQQISLPEEEQSVVDAAVVKERIELLRQRYSTLVDKDGAAERGDVVDIDYFGKLNGADYEGSEGHNRMIELGTEPGWPSLEDNLYGLVAGDDKSFKVTYPEDERLGELALAEVDMRIKVNAVKVKQLPQLDEQFFSNFGDCKTLADFEDLVKNALTEESSSQRRGQELEHIREHISTTYDFAVPQQLVEEMLESQRQKMEQSDFEQQKDELVKQAQQGLRVHYVFNQWAEEHSIKANAADIQRQFFMQCNMLKLDAAKVVNSDLGRRLMSNISQDLLKQAVLEDMHKKITASTEGGA